MLDALGASPAPAPFRVVRIYFRLPPEPGGMEAHIERLSSAQRKLGVDVVNVHNTGEATGASLRLFAGRNLLNVRPAALRNALFYSAALANRARLKEGTVPTVLHVHGDWSDFLLSKLLARAIGAKLVVASVHDTVPAQRLARVYRFVLSHCGVVFSTGRRDQALLEGVLGRAVHHLPSAPADVFFGAGEVVDEGIDVITVANCQPKKRLDLIVACAEGRPDLRFAVYGDGPERARFARQTEVKGLRNIAFRGAHPPADIAKAMKGAKLFLLTSDAEGTPTAALEAMACGLPVVLTPSNDYSWLVVNGVNGHVTSSWDVAELLARIGDVLGDPRRRAQMGLANRRRVEQHTWKETALRVTQLMAASLRLDRVATPSERPAPLTGSKVNDGLPPV